MRRVREAYDIVVCGGGLAGFCAAVAAARHGARTCLVQDRPVLGGNSSSEVRVVPRGAAVYHGYARESGIIAELLIEERARNHEEIFENGWTNSVWDLVLYDTAMRTPGLTVHLNTSIQDVHVTDGRIRSVTGRVAAAETELRIDGGFFIDCTGDGVVADLAGCEWRMGTEGRDEFDEPHAPERASDDVMGNSIHIKTRDVGRPVPFVLPEWAVEYDDASFFYKGGRRPRDARGGYWWIEIGVPWHTIYDAEKIRHELTRHALGIWDWIKNKDPRFAEEAATYALDWIGQVPGKRESRRILGLHLMTQHDLDQDPGLPDEVAYGGWNIDLHTPGGLLAPTSEPTAAEGYQQTSHASVSGYVGPFGIPLRSLIAKDVDNLLLAGRDISASHVALGSVRVQATTAVVGQAAGTAAYVAHDLGLTAHQVPEHAITTVQQTLLRDGAFLPHVANADDRDLARTATVTASSAARLHGGGPAKPTNPSGPMAAPVVAADEQRDVLAHRRGQWIARGPEPLDRLEVCLSNTAPEPVRIPARLYDVEHIWDYRSEPGDPLATTELVVPPGDGHWIGWDVGLPASPEQAGRYVRLDLDASEHLTWHRAGHLVPAHMAAFEMAPGRMRRFGRGMTMSFRVSPPQSCYEPENVISGVTRPHHGTNLWRSDPAAPLDAWLELSWPSPQRIAQVELTFAGNIAHEYDSYPALAADPQCVRDYTLQAWHDGGWRDLVRVEGNYQRGRVHPLEAPVTTSRLRLVVHASNGDPSAAVYEVRCY
ncbi:MAG: FAD-dependent oxidoreductase [Micromonosporaceae bacterium]